MDKKYCPKCKKQKLTSEFARNQAMKDGLQAWCKVCHNKTRRDQLKDPVLLEKERERQRKYYIENEEARKRHREKCNTRHRDRYQNDPEYRQKKNQYKKDRCMTDPEFHRWRKIRDSNRAVIKRSKGRVIHPGFTKEEWEMLCKELDYRCAACHDRKPLTPDHIVPLSKGGSNEIGNIQPLCFECNTRKSNKVIDYISDRG